MHTGSQVICKLLIVLQLFYHRLGTKQSDDILFAEFPDNPKWMRYFEVIGWYFIAQSEFRKILVEILR